MAAAIVMAPMMAHAQIAGGGGGTGGLLQTMIQWIQTNILTGAVLAAVLICGVMMMLGRLTFGFVILVVVGALVVSNASTIAGLFNVTGG